MTDAPPIMLVYEGDGEFKAPNGHWKALADRHYVIGERYNLVPHHYRSRASHSHFFAALNDAWSNLPIEQAMLFPSSEHFRKYLLIKTGWCDTQVFVMSDHEQAVALRRELRSHDQFAVVLVRDNIVTKSTAKSQSERAMGKQEFQKSKDDCLAAAAEMLGTTKKALAENTGQSGDGQR